MRRQKNCAEIAPNCAEVRGHHRERAVGRHPDPQQRQQVAVVHPLHREVEEVRYGGGSGGVGAGTAAEKRWGRFLHDVANT